MKKLIATAFVLAAAAPAVAGTAASAPKSFTRDGVTYTYTVAQQEGRTVIRGKDSYGKAFRLNVTGNRVRGNYADAQVGFVHQASAGGSAAASK